MVVWNPMIGLRPDLENARGKIHFDLLDDWTVHQAFRRIHDSVDEAYSRLFQAADSVSANSEGTLELARRFGRDDTVLMPNGCDPHRFSSRHLGQKKITVGYIGKIGLRLDGDLIGRAVRALPNVEFVFAGPVLEKSVLAYFEKEPNVRMLGDVHYSDIPALLETFDIGWVPHGVESGQVGGDAIKIYEYRAAGLPVLTTPIIGTIERPMNGVIVAPEDIQVEYLKKMIGNHERIKRLPAIIPDDLTWKSKATHILKELNYI
jgi:glycosyltransferase involved in cell wall biosynthesis